MCSRAPGLSHKTPEPVKDDLVKIRMRNLSIFAITVFEVYSNFFFKKAFFHVHFGPFLLELGFDWLFLWLDASIHRDNSAIAFSLKPWSKNQLLVIMAIPICLLSSAIWPQDLCNNPIKLCRELQGICPQSSLSLGQLTVSDQWTSEMEEGAVEMDKGHMLMKLRGYFSVWSSSYLLEEGCTCVCKHHRGTGDKPCI